MPYKIISINLVKYDLADAIDYYNNLSLQLGLRFETDFLQALYRLENTPSHYFNLDNGFRRITFTDFPYMIVYNIDEQTHTNMGSVPSTLKSGVYQKKNEIEIK